MRQRKILSKTLPFLLLLLGLVIYSRRTTAGDPPFYKSHDLGHWASMLADPKGPAVTEPVQAVLTIGSAGIPYYLDWIHYSPPSAKVIAMRCSNSILQVLNPSWALEDTKSTRADGAVAALGLLGDKAIQTVPELTRLSRAGNAVVRARATNALRWMNLQMNHWDGLPANPP
jgi:hypothetical protein